MTTSRATLGPRLAIVLLLALAHIVVVGARAWARTSDDGVDSVYAQPAPGTMITVDRPCVTIPVVIRRTNPTPLRGFSITVLLSDNLTLCGAEFVSGGYPLAPHSFHIMPGAGNRWTIDDVTLGLPCGATGDGTAFTMSVSSVAVGGSGTVTVESVQARDCSNEPIAMVPGAPATIPINPDSVHARPAPGTVITGEHPCVTVPIVITRTDPTPLMGYSVTLQLSSNLTLCGSEFVSAGYPRAPRSFHATPASGNRWIIDEVTLGLPCGATGSGPLFTVDLTSPGADGSGTITVESVQARDCSNQSIAVVPGPAATIPIHRAGPARTLDLTAVQVTTGNHVPPPAVHATTPIQLEFSLPPDAVSAEVYRAKFGGYPQYDENGGVVPALPTYPLPGNWTLTGVSASGQADAPPARDFWYYVLVSKDAYGNASAVSNMTPGTLDYSLGDVSDGTADCTGNDLVATEDVSLLGSNYGITLPVNGTLECLDVGPTVDYSVNARPRTDNKVDFEDLMMFALNYGMVSAPQTSARPAHEAQASNGADQGYIWGPEQVTAGELFTMTLGLQGSGFLQGLSVTLGCNPAVAEPVSVSSNGRFEREGGVLYHIGLNTIDAALLGVRETGLTGAGSFVAVTFRALATGDPGIVVVSDKARDKQNHPLSLTWTRVVGVDELPVRTQFAPAMPTPFSSSTTLEFSLASRGEVELAVFGVDGRRVRTLVKGTQEAGVHRLKWNGTDDQGHRLAAGMYYARMIAGRERFTRTLIRLAR